MTEWHADDTVDQGEPLATRRGFSWTNPQHQPRRNTMTLQELFKIFPAAKEAMDNGTDWAYEPEDSSYAPDTFIGGNTWYTVRYLTGFKVEYGEAFLTVWREWDGDWDIVDEWPLEDGDAEFEKEYAAPAAESYKSYCEWVVTVGDDPCNEFFGVKHVLEEQQTWKVTLARRGDGYPELTNWVQVSGDHRFEEQVFPPREIEDYFNVSQYESAPGRPCYLVQHTWADLHQFAKEAWVVDRPRDRYDSRDFDKFLDVTTTLTMKWSNPDYTNQLRALARKTLDSLNQG